MESIDYFEDEFTESRNGTWGDISRILEVSKEHQGKRLERELSQIEQELEYRKEIHQQAIERIEWQIGQQKKRLQSFYRGPFGGDREGIEATKKKLADLYTQLHEAHRGHWNDRQSLEEERRSILRELAELEDESLEQIF